MVGSGCSLTRGWQEERCDLIVLETVRRIRAGLLAPSPLHSQHRALRGTIGNTWRYSFFISFVTSNLYSSTLHGDNELEKGSLIPLDSGLERLASESRPLKTCGIKCNGVIQYPTTTPSNSKKHLPGVLDLPMFLAHPSILDWVQGPRPESWLFCSEFVWPCAIHLNLPTPKFLCL